MGEADAASGRKKKGGGRKLRILVVTRRLVAAIILGLLLLVPPVARSLYPLKYAEHIVTFATEQQLDPYLVAAVIHVESRFRPDSLSSKGARGLMQIMPDTGRWVAEQMGLTSFEPDDLFDPVINIRIGTWYLADLHRAFQGNPTLVLAAYNGGRGNVRRWIASYEAGSSEGPMPWSEIPFPETRSFVQKVMVTYWIYKLFYPSLGLSGGKSAILQIPLDSKAEIRSSV